MLLTSSAWPFTSATLKSPVAYWPTRLIAPSTLPLAFSSISVPPFEPVGV